MENLKASTILEKIILKGGMMGRIAELYKHDPILKDQFIRECSQQCHHKSAIQQWGEVLVSEIKTYAEKTPKE